MYSGIPTQQPNEELEREIEPVSQDPQPKQKSEGPGKLISEMLQLLSFSEQLRVQAHLIHFNYEGANFTGIHAFLKDEYEMHQHHFDKLGELIRSMDYMTFMCMKGLLGAYKKFKHCESYDPKEMLLTYMENLEDFAFMSKKVAKSAKKVDAIDVDNYMAHLVEVSFKASWFIKATLRRS
jgi:DNA-binding ferritin-like protein